MPIHCQSYYATKSYTKVKEFINEYPESNNIPNSTIKPLINKFEKMGSVHTTLGRGRKKAVTPEKRD